MKITRIRLGRLRVPLKTPFRTALRTVDAIDDIVVRVETDCGRLGYGAAPPTAAITGETHASIIEAIHHYIAPRLIGAEVDDLADLGERIDTAMARNSSAKAAVEIAVQDLFAQLQALPLYQVLGGGAPHLTTDLTISVNAIERMVADARAAVDLGYAALKIKLGREPDLDVDRVRAIHAAVAGRASLRLDANQAWTAAQTVSTLQTLEAQGILPELIEQPVPAHDLDGMRHIVERVQTPLMADESAFDARAVDEILRRGAANIISIKLMKSGGIAQALRIVDVAAQHGVTCMMSCMLEGSISVAAAVHVAVARANVITRIDLDGPALAAFNPVDGGVHFDESHIAIGAGPGLGINAIRGVEWLDA
jgi:L-Ala-D/L-Glu epimerase